MRNTLEFMGACYSQGEVKSKSSKPWELFESRVLQALSEPTLLKFGESLAELMEYAPSGDALQGLIEDADKNEQRILHWISEHYKLASTLATMSVFKKSEFDDCMQEISIEDSPPTGDKLIGLPKPDIQTNITLLSPLSHGSDKRAGNATLFRRFKAKAANGGLLVLPYYAANAARGQIRDLLADHFTDSLGLQVDRKNPPYEAWFFHVLYAGGGLEQAKKGSTLEKAAKMIGERANASVDLGEHFTIRYMVPMLSVLGFSLASQIVGGRFEPMDFIPVCAESGLSDQPASSLMDWEYITRREDMEQLGEEDKHHGMIANYEVMVRGSQLVGGFDIRRNATDLEKSCLAKGLELWRESGTVGGGSRGGFGKCKIEFETDLSGELYDQFLADNKDKILDYLRELGGVLC